MFLTSSFGVDLLLLTIVSLFFLHMRLEIKRGHWQWIDPFNGFWAGVLILYVFQPIVYYAPLRSAYGEAVIMETLGWIIWALIWLIIGYRSKWGVKAGLKLPSMPARFDPTLITAAGVVMVLLGVVGYVYLFASAGGVTAWLSVGRGGTDVQGTVGYLAALENFLPAGVALLLFRAELIPTTAIFRIVLWAMAILQWFWFAYLGSRSRTIFFLLSMGAAYYLPRRKSPHWLLISVTGVFLFLLSGFLAGYRGQFTNLSFHLDEISWDDVRGKILPEKLGGNIGQDNGKSLGDLEFNCTAAVVDTVPKIIPYNYGYTLLELVTKAVPRFIWPTKIYPMYEVQSPIMQERDLSRHWMETPTTRFLVGPAFTFVGYWYHAGGGVALMIAGFLTGAGFRTIRMYFDRDPLNKGNLILYALLLPIGFQECAATPLYWVFTLPLIVIPVLILMYMARDRSEVAAQPDMALESYASDAKVFT